MSANPNEGEIVEVKVAGWAGDTSFIVRHGDELIEVDAYQAGTALLHPGEVITLPEPDMS